MNPGTLDRRITLLAPQAVQHADGESVPVFVAYATDIPAGQVNPTTGQLLVAGAQLAPQRHVIRLRYRTDVRSGHRALFEGGTYTITGWGENPKAPRRSEILLTCEEAKPTPDHVTAP